MKDSNQVLALASINILIGVILTGLSRSNITSTNNPFLSSQAFVTMGFLFFGFSLGLLATIGYIVRLEKKTLRTPQSP